MAGRPIVFQPSGSRNLIFFPIISSRDTIILAVFLLFCFPTTIGISVLSQSRHLTLTRPGVNQPARQERDQSTTTAHKRSADISFVLFLRHTDFIFHLLHGSALGHVVLVDIPLWEDLGYRYSADGCLASAVWKMGRHGP